MGIPVSFAPEDAHRRIQETLKANSARPLFTQTAVSFVLQAIGQMLTSISKKPQKFCPISILPGLMLVAEIFYHSTEASMCYRLELQDMIMGSALVCSFLAVRLIFSSGL